MQKLYLADVICGHVGKNWGVEKTLCITAQSRKEAAEIARLKPRVKHHHPKAVLDVREVEIEEYIQQLVDNYFDPYFTSKNKQEQNKYCPDIEKFRMSSLEQTYRSRKSRPVSEKAYELRYKAS